MCQNRLLSTVPRMTCAILALALLANQATTSIAQEAYCADQSPYIYASEPYCATYPPPAAKSAMDVPLNWYFMPRRPGCARHDYRYRVEMPEPCPVNLGCCGQETCGGACGLEDYQLAPELLDHFAPIGFERLGQIPNDSLLGAAVVGQ